MADPFEFLRRDLESISRALGPNLLPAVFNIAGRTFVVGYTELKDYPAIKRTWRAEVQLGEVGKGIIGGMTLYLRPGTRSADIDWAQVTDRRQGIGREMVQAVEKDLKSRGYREITLHSVPDVIPFWQNLGYRPVGAPDSEGGLDMRKRI